MIKLERAAYQIEERVAVYIGLSTDDYTNIRRIRNGDRYFAMDTKQWYRYDQENSTWIATNEGGGARGAYIAGGSVTFANLPPLNVNYLGYVYNVSDAFTTTSDFVDGAGLEFPAGTNVVVVSVPDGQGGEVFKYDVLGNFVDLDTVKDVVWTITLDKDNWSNKAQTIQDSRFATNGYNYSVSPAPTNLYTYANCGIYAEDIAVDGAITFVCDVVPTVDFTVNIKKSPTV